MNIQYNPSFIRDVKKATPNVQIDLYAVIDSIKTANSLSDIFNVKKLKKLPIALGFMIIDFVFYYDLDKTLILARFLPRKDIYRFFS